MLLNLFGSESHKRTLLVALILLRYLFSNFFFFPHLSYHCLSSHLLLSPVFSYCPLSSSLSSYYFFYFFLSSLFSSPFFSFPSSPLLFFHLISSCHVSFPVVSSNLISFHLISLFLFSLVSIISHFYSKGLSIDTKEEEESSS